MSLHYLADRHRLQPLAQILASRVGIPFERINLIQGDSDALIAGGGTGGSKSLMASGGAIVEASEEVIENGRKIAGEVLEAAVADIEFDISAGAGQFRVAGTDRHVGIMELAEMLHTGLTLPPGMPASLIGGNAPSAFPNGSHICEVEIDPETGESAVVRYAMVNEFGLIVNPLLVEGQAHGGIVQGIGQALKESLVYDADGQLVTGSYMDYALPAADDAPPFQFVSHPVPTRTNRLGAKGCGEAGCVGSLPSVMNAIVDALADYGITQLDMSATPMRIWQAIQQSKSASPKAVRPST
jgi:carbon-monoxide dehydrogenase large subunit